MIEIAEKKSTSKDKLKVCTEKYESYAPTVLRIFLGIIFLIAGYSKFFVMGVGGFTGMLSGLGIPLAGFFAALVAIIELLGGIALILGVAPRITSCLLAIIMLVAIFTVHLSNGWAPNSGGVAYPFMILGALIAQKLLGAGKLALWNNW